jgi:hypothetical protein
MAALLEMLRNHQQHPAMNEHDRHAAYGTYPPRVRRASLAGTPQQTATRPAPKHTSPTDALDGDTVQVPLPTTDELENEPHASKHLIALRNRDTTDSSQFQTRRSFWQVTFTGLCWVTGIATLLYTILFLIVAGWILLTNTFSYGPTHTAYTLAVINGQATTIQTSNVNGTILITLINDRDGTIKTYTGPALSASAWNNDLSGIVATTNVEANQATPTITVHLIGNVNYFHLLFARPQMAFQLLPDKHADYKVVSAS